MAEIAYLFKLHASNRWSQTRFYHSKVPAYLLYTLVNIAFMVCNLLHIVMIISTITTDVFVQLSYAFEGV